MLCKRCFLAGRRARGVRVVVSASSEGVLRRGAFFWPWQAGRPVGGQHREEQWGGGFGRGWAGASREGSRDMRRTAPAAAAKLVWAVGAPALSLAAQVNKAFAAVNNIRVLFPPQTHG